VCSASLLDRDDEAEEEVEVVVEYRPWANDGLMGADATAGTVYGVLWVEKGLEEERVAAMEAWW